MESLFLPQKKHLYIAFYKPQKTLTTLSDPKNRRTVIDFLHSIPERIFPVGRLDWNTEGLLLLTNDGDFALKITHPSKKITKTYLVKLDGRLKQAQKAKLLKGVSTPQGKVKALRIETIKMASKKYEWVKIIIAEGKNRQIHNMFEKVGLSLKKLKRIAIGGLKIGKFKTNSI